MTLAEFKAWFEGFTEEMDAAPTSKQWKRIKARVAQIDGVAVTREVVYRDKYWPTQIYGSSAPHYSTTTIGVRTCTSAMGAQAQNASASGSMVNLGKAEYTAMLS